MRVLQNAVNLKKGFFALSSRCHHHYSKQHKEVMECWMFGLEIVLNAKEKRVTSFIMFTTERMTY